eukprot:COSAG02_NODE_2059_length_9974_cov_6.226532_1_plen_73_part_00
MTTQPTSSCHPQAWRLACVQEDLEKHAGIPDIEVVDPKVPGFAQRAAFLLNRDGVRSGSSSPIQFGVLATAV